MTDKTSKKTFKAPRLYVEAPLKEDEDFPLTLAHAHYLRNVLRRSEGDNIRLFNGRDGEWLATLTALDRKSATARPQTLLIPQPQNPQSVHLLFAPLKKTRLDWLIEKAVELGVTDLYPVLTQNTEMRYPNEQRINLQILEAAEQCERLEIPTLHPLQTLNEILQDWNNAQPLYAALEREDAPLLSETLSQDKPKAPAFLIGPEGGFTAEEKDALTNHSFVKPVSLGPRILRAETAALYALSQI